MPDVTSHPHGTPSWVDLTTPDQPAAKAFYAGLFGWTYDDNPMPETDAVYSMAMLDGKAVAAISPQQQEMIDAGAPPLWNTYITVDDLEAAVGRVEAAGGTVMAPPFDVMEAGRMAVLVDSAGAFFLLWSPKDHIGAERVNEPGCLAWNELMTPDVDAAAAFYGAVFGWGTQTFEGQEGYTVFTRASDGEGIAGAMNPPMEGIPPNWGVYFAVEDCDATVSAASQAGGSVLNGPMDIAVGRIATITDPQGGMFNVITLAPPTT